MSILEATDPKVSFKDRFITSVRRGIEESREQSRLGEFGRHIEDTNLITQFRSRISDNRGVFTTDGFANDEFKIGPEGYTHYERGENWKTPEDFKKVIGDLLVNVNSVLSSFHRNNYRNDILDVDHHTPVKHYITDKVQVSKDKDSRGEYFRYRQYERVKGGVDEKSVGLHTPKEVDVKFLYKSLWVLSKMFKDHISLGSELVISCLKGTDKELEGQGIEIDRFGLGIIELLYTMKLHENRDFEPLMKIATKLVSSEIKGDNPVQELLNRYGKYKSLLDLKIIDFINSSARNERNGPDKEMGNVSLKEKPLRREVVRGGIIDRIKERTTFLSSLLDKIPEYRRFPIVVRNVKNRGIMGVRAAETQVSNDIITGEKIMSDVRLSERQLVNLFSQVLKDFEVGFSKSEKFIHEGNKEGEQVCKKDTLLKILELVELKGLSSPKMKLVIDSLNGTRDLDSSYADKLQNWLESGTLSVFKDQDFYSFLSDPKNELFFSAFIRAVSIDFADKVLIDKKLKLNLLSSNLEFTEEETKSFLALKAKWLVLEQGEDAIGVTTEGEVDLLKLHQNMLEAVNNANAERNPIAFNKLRLKEIFDLLNRKERFRPYYKKTLIRIAVGIVVISLLPLASKAINMATNPNSQNITPSGYSPPNSIPFINFGDEDSIFGNLFKNLFKGEGGGLSNSKSRSTDQNNDQGGKSDKENENQPDVNPSSGQNEPLQIPTLPELLKAFGVLSSSILIEYYDKVRKARNVNIKIAMEALFSKNSEFTEYIRLAFIEYKRNGSKSIPTFVRSLLEFQSENSSSILLLIDTLSPLEGEDDRKQAEALLEKWKIKGDSKDQINKENLAIYLAFNQSLEKVLASGEKEGLNEIVIKLFGKDFKRNSEIVSISDINTSLASCIELYRLKTTWGIASKLFRESDSIGASFKKEVKTSQVVLNTELYEFVMSLKDSLANIKGKDYAKAYALNRYLVTIQEILLGYNATLQTTSG